MTLLLKLGLKKTKTEKISTRSYKTREVIQDWVGEVDNTFPKNADWGWKLAEDTYKREIEKIEKYHKDIADKKAAEEKKAADELKNQEKTALLVSLTQKYGFKFNSPIPDINDLIQELIKKNRYLYLAVYMAKNRGDWSDNYNYTETGLDFFRQECDKVAPNKMDSEIYDEVYSVIENWDGDGRATRDLPTWNYDALFSLAAEQNSELYEDYQRLLKYQDYLS